MRWNRPKLGVKRTRRRFLLLPKRIGNEVHWLEWAEWKESCEINIVIGTNYWSPIHWVDDG